VSIKQTVENLVLLGATEAEIARALRDTGADIYDVAQEMNRFHGKVRVSDEGGVLKLIIDVANTSRAEGGDIVVWKVPETYKGISQPLSIYAVRYEVAIGGMEVATSFFKWLGFTEVLELRRDYEGALSRVFETSTLSLVLFESQRISSPSVGESMLIFNASGIIDSFVDFKIDLTEWTKRHNVRINETVVEGNRMSVTIGSIFLFKIAFVKG